MTILRDFKNRIYKVVDVNRQTTLLEDLNDGSRVRIRSFGIEALGFVKP